MKPCHSCRLMILIALLLVLTVSVTDLAIRVQNNEARIIDIVWVVASALVLTVSAYALGVASAEIKQTKRQPLVPMNITAACDDCNWTPTGDEPMYWSRVIDTSHHLKIDWWSHCGCCGRITVSGSFKGEPDVVPLGKPEHECSTPRKYGDDPTPLTSCPHRKDNTHE